jgi:type IV secretion system protein VirB5
MAVVDAAAIAKLASQIETLEAQLQQAQAEFDSMTGGRGMEGLLAGTVRNYLPADWATLEAALRAAGTSPLGRQVDALVTANAILSAAQVGTLSAEERETLDSARRSAALLQVTTREALERTSERFDALEELIGAIGTAGDQKAVLDLQARIAAEQSMLQNEQTKLLVLFQLAHAEELARKQRARERAIAGIGALRRLPPVGLNN